MYLSKVTLKERQYKTMSKWYKTVKKEEKLVHGIFNPQGQKLIELHDLEIERLSRLDLKKEKL